MQGIVIRSTGAWYEVRTNDKNIISCRLRGKFKLQDLKVTNPIAVGDKVEWEWEKDQKTGVITDILPRENYIIRKSVHKTAHAHLIATNIDQAIIIATLVAPRTSFGFIDRFLVSAETFRIPAVVVFNKSDLLDQEALRYQAEIMQIYTDIGYTCLQTSVLTQEGILDFEKILQGKVSLLSGHSGVGKSSLINAINPSLNLKTGEISDFSQKGKHTTTFAEMFELSENTFIIDTPGIKELGLVEIETDELSHYFPEMRKYLGECKFGSRCLHTHEPHCKVIEAVESGEIALFRYESYLSMLANEDNRR
ncbi:ribosome small subunit-dependent GTPase A [Raineya orbicola]|uniref:Small ribosomal subunit biogenesis GTPase RsgA n=1 Tax=Raineya orbicola TaxID=2016530 RepID=A0A2N3IE63_9BACT|nr:ribosome small subunit-dependent GTPase A [Raineya orbicola]PKQ68617.1 ribosome small subunit-dependent GTPase A [Raineya orbicola]